MSKIHVITDPENPIAVELIEQAIVDVAAGMKRINASRLNRRAITALIKDATGLNKTTIETVLNNLDDLERMYLKKKEK